MLGTCIVGLHKMQGFFQVPMKKSRPCFNDKNPKIQGVPGSRQTCVNLCRIKPLYCSGLKLIPVLCQHYSQVQNKWAGRPPVASFDPPVY